MTPKQKMKKPIFTNKAPEALGPYSQAIQWGDVVFISGQIPLIPSTGELNDASFSDQANQVIDNIEAICIEAGASLDHILKLTIFLTNLEKFDVQMESDQSKLYKLIWLRTIASQMNDALLERTTLKIKSDVYKNEFVKYIFIITVIIWMLYISQEILNNTKTIFNINTNLINIFTIFFQKF